MNAMLAFLSRSMAGSTWTFDFLSATVTDITGHLSTHHAMSGTNNVDDTAEPRQLASIGLSSFLAPEP